jgi:hypothetical protein
VANARGGHGLKHAWGHVAWPRPHEHPRTRINISEIIRIKTH